MEQANHHHRQPELSCREGVSRALRSLIPTRETIIVVTGIQAAGKSTVSHLLAQRFARGVHVEADVLQHMIVSGSEGVQEPVCWLHGTSVQKTHRLHQPISLFFHFPQVND